MTNRQKRFATVLGLGGTLALALYLILSTLEDNLVFYFSPQEMITKNPEPQKKVRLGGMVKSNSLETLDDQSIRFVVTDFMQELTVVYRGNLPDLFRAGQGVVAEGFYQGIDEPFQAKTILAKHDETYRPPAPGETRPASEEPQIKGRDQ